MPTNYFVKHFWAALFFFSSLAFGQSIIAPASTVNGVPATNLVTICNTNPGSGTCGSLVTTYTTFALSVTCSGTGGPLSGTGCSNPGYSDSAGNIVAFAAAGQYWCQYKASANSTPNSLPCSAGGAGAAGFPVSSAQSVNTGGSISQASGIGQIAATQDWWTIGPPAPTVNAWTNTGGSLNSTHGYSFKFRYNSAAGGITGAELQATPVGPCASTACTVVLNAPTLPSGYTSYTVGMTDCGSGTCTGNELILAACTNLSSGVACTASTTGSGALSVTNTAYAQPSPLGTNLCSPGTNPALFGSDGTNYYALMGIDSANTGSNPPAPYNKLSICRPMWLNDTATDPPAGRNSLQLIYHLQNGTVTNIANQDRGMFIYTTNSLTSSDSTTHYALEGLQVEQDLNGTPTINGSPDGEVTAISSQLADFHTTTLASPNSYGIGAGRYVYFRESNAGTWSGGIGGAPMHGILSVMQNNSTVSGASAFSSAFQGQCNEASGSPSAIFCINFYANFTGTYTGQWGFYSNDSGSCTTCYNYESDAANENQGKNAFQGNTFFSHISAGNLTSRINFTNPTCTFATGGGTGPTCAIRAGSSDSMGRMVLTPGTTPAGTGTVTLTFHTAFVAPVTDVSCNFTSQNNSGTWNGLNVLVVTAHSLSAVTVQFTNGTTPTALTAASTYDINYQCWGN